MNSEIFSENVKNNADNKRTSNKIVQKPKKMEDHFGDSLLAEGGTKDVSNYSRRDKSDDCSSDEESGCTDKTNESSEGELSAPYVELNNEEVEFDEYVSCETTIIQSGDIADVSSGAEFSRTEAVEQRQWTVENNNPRIPPLSKEKIDLIKHTMGKISIPQRAGAESIFRAIDKCNFRVGDEIENNSKIE